MEPGHSMSHPQAVSNNSDPDPNQSHFSFIQIFSFYQRLGFPKVILPIGLPIIIFKAFLPSSILVA